VVNVGDIVTPPKTPQISEAVEINLTMCELCTKMILEMNYREYDSVRDTYSKFRGCLIALYYLVRLEKGMREKKIIKKIDVWKTRKTRCNSKNLFPMCWEAIGLYEDLSKDLVSERIL
jgi:hypothetical protein